MKKILFVLVLVFSITLTFAQKNVRQTASNFLKDGKLDKALEAINQCLQDASTAQDAKAWFIKGNIYLEILNSKDEKYKSLDPDPLQNALEAYKKSLEYDAKPEMIKKEYYDAIFEKLAWVNQNNRTLAVDAYNKKQNKDAMNYFATAAKAMEMINVPDTLSFFYAGICATQANEKKKAIEFYETLIKYNSKSPEVYNSLSDLYRMEKDSSNALRVVRQGQKLFPNDLKLFLVETNIYLTFNDTPKALRNLTIATQKDTANKSVFFALGTICDNLANDTAKDERYRLEFFDKAIKAYKKALQLDPDYFEANYNLGALYVNKAASFEEKANKLPLDAEEAYNKLKVEANQYLELALPYLEKASSIQPTDIAALFSLKQIYSRMGQKDKLKEIVVKIDALQNKK